MLIRPGEPDDAPALAGLHVRAWQAAYRGMLPDDYLDGLAEQTVRREAMWRQVIGELAADQPLWVAEDGRRVVGFVNTAPAREGPPGVGELLSIYVEPDLIGRGVGAALMTTALADFRGRGRVAAILWVLEANERARRFYERFGWHLDGAAKEEDLWGARVREIRYRIDLVMKQC